MNNRDRAGSIYHEKTLTEGKLITNTSVEEHYKYCIVLAPELYQDAYNWAEEIFPKNHSVHWTTRRWFTSGSWNSNKYYYHFYFKDSEDAVLFGLRWK